MHSDGRIEAHGLKEQILLYKHDAYKNHPNIIKIEDQVSKKIIMGSYTVVAPTNQVAPPM